jgi:hypothetical protein
MVKTDAVKHIKNKVSKFEQSCEKLSPGQKLLSEAVNRANLIRLYD